MHRCLFPEVLLPPASSRYESSLWPETVVLSEVKTEFFQSIASSTRVCFNMFLARDQLRERSNQHVA